MRFLFPRFFSVLCLSFAVALAATPVRALTVSNSDTLSPGFSGMLAPGDSTFDFGIGPDDVIQTRTYTLQRFDGSLGTLNSVRIDFAQSALAAQSTDGAAVCQDFNPGCIISRTLQLSQQVSVGVGTASGATPLQSVTGTGLCDLFGACPDLMLTQTFNESIEFTVAADLANFVGPGDFTATAELDVFAGVSRQFGPNFPLEAIDEVFFDGTGTATVTYDYTPTAVAIPAPAGAAFLLIGFAALTRRKRA